jgi:hypothetical protein
MEAHNFVILNGHNIHNYSSHDKDYTNREYVLIRSEYGIINNHTFNKQYINTSNEPMKVNNNRGYNK